MAEWLFEAGIGEQRAALVEDGRIVRASIARDSDGIRAGAIVAARLTDRRNRIAVLDDGEEALLTTLAPALTEGAAFLVEITRSSLRERDLVKRAIARPAADGAAPPSAPTLAQRCAATDVPVRHLAAHEPDALAAAGWAELVDEAQTGIIPFPEGAAPLGLLRLALTPAHVVIDIDGAGDVGALAPAAARAIAHAMLRHDIGGSVIVDFPRLADKAARVAVADAFDAAWAGAGGGLMERTAINGYGLLQIITPRRGPSLPERIQLWLLESAALNLLRLGERARGTDTLTLVAAPAVIGWIKARAALLDDLARRSGRTPHLQADASLGMDAGHVQ